MATAKTGNPRGRPKGATNLSTREMKAAAQAHGADIIAGLMAIFNDKNQPGNFRVMAGREVLDRGYGKVSRPVKVQEGFGRFDWSRIPDDKLKLVDEVLRIAQTDGVVIDHE